ncbi:hypothetical protein Tco_0740927 [Tanacetum coccineum]
MYHLIPRTRADSSLASHLATCHLVPMIVCHLVPRTCHMLDVRAATWQAIIRQPPPRVRKWDPPDTSLLMSAGETRLFYRRLARINLLQSSLREESNA